ncbi:signal peptidase I [Paenibacillus nasutitermitis]|uniref:Signal peptidase I n=1 Tax=Paenibacillus nasutitermitis TaxID=1652958 RepID=A0A916ZF04_9BACL|nr:signal peptidase I [Paenibacillus nasutitermitis]GGD91215.1 signal peptidase I [Paenibacillus nasutitermitis]
MTEEIEVKSQRASLTRKKKGVWGWIRFFLIVGAAFIIINNLTGIVKVSGNSMNPTLQSGNILLINKFSLFLGVPKYGDVVVIKEDRLGYSIVKRVIAVEGDKVAIVDGVTYVNGAPLVELYTYGQSEDMEEMTMGIDELFVAGDNRNLGESLDSRDPQLGPVHIGDIRGYAALSLWPMHRISKPLKL